MSELSIYGLNAIIREYTNYPPGLRLLLNGEHGWGPATEPNPGDLLTQEPIMLVTNKRRLQGWKEKSSIPAVIMGSPFVHYRNLKRIEKDQDASGTVAFPAHSTDLMESVFDIEGYCKLLNSLPSEYHPISICLHADDFARKKDEIYKEYGFKVVTAGPKFVSGFEFVQNFYDILRSHKYATSNQVGSYSFYAVEMGIPFFVLGDAAVIVNSGDRLMPAKYSVLDFPMGVYATEVFRGLTQVISEEQKKFVEEELGVHDCLSGEELRQVLLESNKKAIEAFQEFLETGQGTVDEKISICRKLIYYFQGSGEKDKLLEAILKTFEFDPPKAEFCCHLGYYFMSTHKYDQAAFWFKLATQLKEPLDNLMKYRLNIQLSVCYDRLGKRELAYEHNEIAGMALPGDSQVIYNKKYMEREWGMGSPDKKEDV